ncbi:hypothetical protein K9N08_02415 [Candidatus Gracilibacteria bacterium]|nr:hypothetical protein [Candidatus Gracilibacteria bacterium]MCF7856389.1 hypothetical protein [Candidatus Gracilibacteria bacterium]MCF7896815.1 hypothetical protein [Candidatus Gracilibacteria bacterium]
MFKKTILAATLAILLVGCASVYDTTLPVDLTPEQVAAFKAEIVKYDDLIIQTPAFKKLVAEKMAQEQAEAEVQPETESQPESEIDPETEEELPEEAGFFLTSDPTDFRPPADLFISKAIALENLGRVGEALRTYDEMFALYENSSVGWHNRGRLYEKIGDAAEAVENYKKLIDVFSLTQYRFDIAEAWQKAGELEKAKTAYLLWQKETGNKNSSFAEKIGL